MGHNNFGQLHFHDHFTKHVGTRKSFELRVSHIFHKGVLVHSCSDGCRAWWLHRVSPSSSLFDCAPTGALTRLRQHQESATATRALAAHRETSRATGGRARRHRGATARALFFLFCFEHKYEHINIVDGRRRASAVHPTTRRWVCSTSCRCRRCCRDAPCASRSFRWGKQRDRSASPAASPGV